MSRLLWLSSSPGPSFPPYKPGTTVPSASLGAPPAFLRGCHTLWLRFAGDCWGATSTEPAPPSRGARCDPHRDLPAVSDGPPEPVARGTSGDPAPAVQRGAGGTPEGVALGAAGGDSLRPVQRAHRGRGVVPRAGPVRPPGGPRHPRPPRRGLWALSAPGPSRRAGRVPPVQEPEPVGLGPVVQRRWLLEDHPHRQKHLRPPLRPGRRSHLDQAASPLRRCPAGQARRSATPPGWEATIVYRDVRVGRLPSTGRAAGVDVGIAVLAAVADDHGDVQLVANPAPLTRALRRLQRAQQTLAVCQKGSNRRRRARRRVARLHEQIRQQRRQHAHQLSARLVANYDLIAVEDLRIPNMTRSARGIIEAPGRGVAAKSGLNRSIHDAGWGQLVNLLTYKAGGAGRKLVRVPAAQTSQTCAACGGTDPASRPDRDHFTCTACGLSAHPDANAAQVILAIATGSLIIPRPPPVQRPGSGHRDAA